jgi:hypothetical protein
MYDVMRRRHQRSDYSIVTLKSLFDQPFERVVAHFDPGSSRRKSSAGMDVTIEGRLLACERFAHTCGSPLFVISLRPWTDFLGLVPAVLSVAVESADPLV